MSTKVDGCRDAVDRLTTGSGNEPGPLQARFALNGLRQIVQFQLASLDVTNKSGFPACFPLAPGAMIAARNAAGNALVVVSRRDAPASMVDIPSWKRSFFDSCCKDAGDVGVAIICRGER